MLCKLCHLERACKKKKKAAPTITATFRGQIRASENTRDSPETRARFCRVLKGPALIDVGGASRSSHGVAGGGCHLNNNQFRNQDGFRCETLQYGRDARLASSACVNGQVLIKVAVETQHHSVV